MHFGLSRHDAKNVIKESMLMEKNLRARGLLLVVIGIVSVLSSVPIWAAEQTMSLPMVIEYSLQHNGDLQSFRQEKGVFGQAGT